VAATSQAELLAVTDKEFAKFIAVCEGVPEALAMVKDADDTSIKDVVAHRAHWTQLFLGWYHDGLAGKEVHFPAPGYKWNELKRYNAALRAQQAGLEWPAAMALVRGSHAQLRAFIASSDDSILYAGPMKGARNAWTPGRWAEAAGPSHYRSAAKYIRARMRQLS